jgi:hypothetical protein
MTKFLLSYHGGDAPKDQAEGDAVMKAWTDWMGGLGKALLDPGNPTTTAKTVAASGKVSDGGGANPVTGWSVIEAKDMDAAVKVAKGCPQLKSNGSIEVSEIMVLM